MTLVKQSESKQNLKLNKANSKTTQNVSNAKKKKKLTSNHIDLSTFFDQFAHSSTEAICKNQRKNKLKFTKK